MYNPYMQLTPEILEALLRQPMYFVRQQYPRGRSRFRENDQPLLFTHYAHHETDRERADRHIRLLYKDPYRFLYDSNQPEHREKLLIAASQPAGFSIYINLLPKKWKAGDLLKGKISRYVAEKMPWWKYSAKDKLNVTLKERYGELFIVLLWRGQQTEVHLDLIENHPPCVMT